MKNTLNYTFLGALSGAALTFVILKLMKNPNIGKGVLIGAGTGSAVGLLLGVMEDMKTSKTSTDEQENLVTEAQVKAFAKSLGIDAELKVNSYLTILNQIPHTSVQKQNVLNVINVMLKAMKDGKWNEEASLPEKKQILLAYGVKESEFNSFQQIVVSNLTNIITGFFNK
jgi:hypothetical protein